MCFPMGMRSLNGRFPRERDENTMKNRTMLITAGFGLMMILSLFIGSAGVLAGSAGSLSSPLTGSITAVAISSPANNSYSQHDYVNVTWTVTGADSSTYNLTNIWNATGGWQGWVNDTVYSYANFTNLADGIYYVNVMAVNPGQDSRVANVTFTVDTVAPSVAITKPAEGLQTNATDVQMNWTATDSTSGIAYMHVWNDTHAFVNMTSGDGYLFAGMSEGPHKLYLKVWDKAGNSNIKSVNVSIGPNVKITNPLDGTFTNNDNLTFTWTVGLYNGQAILFQQINVTNIITGKNWTMALNGTTFNTSVYKLLKKAVLMDGSYTVKVIANDTNSSGKDIVNFVVDTMKPTIVVNTPGAYTNDNNTTFQWTMNGTGSPISNVELTLKSVTGNFTYGPISVGTNDSANVWNIFGILMNNGNWKLTLNVTDAAGNYNSTVKDFMVDTVKPTVGITVPTEGSFVNSTNVEVIYSAADPASPVASGIASLSIRADSGNWTNLTVGSDDHKINGLIDGQHTIELRAIDNAGNTNTTNVTFTVDTILPEVQITAPTNGTITNVNEVNVTWTGSDLNFAYFEVKNDTGSFVNVGTNLFQVFTGLLDGQHTVWVMAVDMAGNTNTTNVMFTVDTVAPSVTITNPVDGLYTNVTSVQMNWTAVDSGTGIAYMHVRNDTGAFVNMTSGDGYLFTNLSQGTHILYVEAWDFAGNAQLKSVSIVVELTPLEIAITYPQADQHLNDAAINATWEAFISVSPITKIWVAIDSNPLVDVGLNTSQLFVNVSDGAHTIYVKAMDAAGNSAIVNVSFVVDTVAPTIVGHFPASGAMALPDTVVNVTFSEAMNQSSVMFTGITGTMTWNVAGTEVTLTHAALTYATTYSVAVSGKDLAGNSVTGSWNFTTVTRVTGTVTDSNGNPIANATVTLTQGTTVVQGVTDANGNFALIVNGGVYNLTISASGYQDLVQNGVTFGVGQNNTVSALKMTSNATDYTWLIVGIIIVLAIILVVLFLWRRGKVKTTEVKTTEVKETEVKEKP